MLCVGDNSTNGAPDGNPTGDMFPLNPTRDLSSWSAFQYRSSLEILKSDLFIDSCLFSY